VISEQENAEGGREEAEGWAGWRGQSHTPRRRLWTWVLVSSALHAPLTPLVALLGLVGLLDPSADDLPPAPPITEIPLDLLPDDGPDPAAKAAAEKAAAESGGAPVEAPPKPKEAKVDTADAGAPSDAGADGGDAEAVAQAAAEGGLEGREKGTGEQIGDPVALSGAAGKIADANANIRLILYTERMRAHPLARRVGSMLSQAYQWRDFFGPSGIDPIQDVDRILLAGPELRDSSQVVAVMQYNVSEERMRAAVDALVQRDANGEWLDAGAPAARARADRADRLFVMPAPKLVVVTPPSAERHALSLSPKTRFPRAAGDEAVTAYILKPSQSLRGLPIRLPASLKWLRIKAKQADGGGAVVYIHGLDESAELAEHHAQMLQEGVTAMSRLDLGLFGVLLGRSETRFIERVDFTSDGRNIRGELSLTEQQLASIVDLLTQLMGGTPRRPQAPPVEAGAETPGTRPSEPRAPQPPSMPSLPEVPPVPEVPPPEPPATP
jgi:hypothetical protein